MERDLSTSERLLNSAKELFSEKGYSQTSTREIADSAGANIAAINYHFGSKENLYKEVIRTLMNNRRCEREKLLESMKEKRDVALEEMIRTFVRGHIEHMTRHADCAEEINVIFREISNPGPGFDIIIEEMIKPTHEMFQKLIMSYYPDISKEKASLCIASLMGQIIHFVKAKKVISYLIEREYDDATTDLLCDHIVRFTVAGLEASR